MNQRTARALRFGVFEVDLQTGEVRKGGLKIRVQEQPLQILAMLLERPGEVVTRDDLRQRLWPKDTFVDFDHSLNSAMNKLREALGDSADSPRFVETLARRGYRFIAPVEAIDGVASQAESAPAQQPTVEASVAASSELSRLRRQRLVLAAALVAAAGIGLTIWLRQPGGVRKPVVQRLTFAPREA